MENNNDLYQSKYKYVNLENIPVFSEGEQLKELMETNLEEDLILGLSEGTIDRVLKDKLNALYIRNFLKQSSQLPNVFGDNLFTKVKSSFENIIEYPDEFYDPIMDCLIVNPVILPNSNVIMEKYVIEKHLLTSDLDPFTRDKLTIDILKKFDHLIVMIVSGLAATLFYNFPFKSYIIISPLVGLFTAFIILKLNK